MFGALFLLTLTQSLTKYLEGMKKCRFFAKL
jgi:hypothetical protein